VTSDDDKVLRDRRLRQLVRDAFIDARAGRSLAWREDPSSTQQPVTSVGRMW
jgi:hypothetical protein